MRSNNSLTWRTIESAPRDGTMILVAEPHADLWLVHQARWLDCPQEVNIADSNSYRLVPTMPGWYMTYPAVYVGRTTALRPNGASWHSKTLCLNATHWMPLPAPPSQRTLARTLNKLYSTEDIVLK